MKHEAESRHVTCAEHGEQLEVASSTSHQDDGCGQSHLFAVDGDGGGKHQDCALARLLRTSTRTSEGLHLHVTTVAVVSVEVSPPLTSVRSADVILIAPKTSPPV
jgi:hypothetical protein